MTVTIIILKPPSTAIVGSIQRSLILLLEITIASEVLP